MSLRLLHALRTLDSDAGRSIRAVCELAAAQRQFGHVIEIVTLGPDGATALDHLGLPLHRLPEGWGSSHYSSVFVHWMKAHASKYDCVLVHGIWDICALGTWQALRESNVPYFVFPHGMLDPWHQFRHPLRHLLRWLYWPWGGFPVLRDAHAVFFLSDGERRRAQEAFWLYDCHEFVVRTGTWGLPPALADGAAEAFLAAHPTLRGKRLFTFFADHQAETGIHTLVQAIGLLSRQGVWDDRSMRLVLAGSADRPAGEAAARAARHSGLGDSGYWAGTLGEREAWGALRASEVLLRPSAYEVCGRAVADALSAGTPVLLSAGVAVWKDVMESGGGWADQDTGEGFARLLRRWIELPAAEQEVMRRRARECFDERFTLVGAAHALSSAIYLMIGVHRDRRWDLKPLKPASELP